jgi:energy-coupling factor transport system permease protein
MSHAGNRMSPGVSVLFYRRLASPLHATRATVGALWASALIACALLIDHPAVLAVLALCALSAGAAAGVGRELGRSLRMAAVVAVPIVLGNVLVSRQGLTVFARLGNLGPFGQGDLTLEALVYGAVIALKVAVVMLATTLFSLAVDPDELLRAARRLSFRSALTASLATRMVPVLGRDAQRLAEAQRTREAAHVHLVSARGRTQRAHLARSSSRAQRVRAASSPTRAQRARMRARLLSAMVGSSLDRAMDVAATLELRGFACAKAAAPAPQPWSRHDFAFAASALGMVALAVLADLGALVPFRAYPHVHIGVGLPLLALCLALAAVALAPLVDRRGIV